jgi:hypothetical protein
MMGIDAVTIDGFFLISNFRRVLNVSTLSSG